ncbi:hypothetical protein RCL1_005859 [Eukaryota sp. TZLM3-RCL]
MPSPTASPVPFLTSAQVPPSFDTSPGGVRLYNAFADEHLADYWNRKSVQRTLRRFKTDFVNSLILDRSFDKRLNPLANLKTPFRKPKPPSTSPSTHTAFTRSQPTTPCNPRSTPAFEPKRACSAIADVSKTVYFPKRSPANSDSRFKPTVSPTLLSELGSRNIYSSFCYTPPHQHQSSDFSGSVYPLPKSFSSPVRRTVGNAQRFVEKIQCPVLNRVEYRK